MRVLRYAVLAAALAVGCEKLESSNAPITSPNPSKPESTASDRRDQNPPLLDNAAVNRRDTQPDAKTPIDQNENQADINMTAEVRKRILETKDLSVYARNAKVITANGKVTLRGPVDSEAGARNPGQDRDVRRR